jgi:hypothetical protein
MDRCDKLIGWGEGPRMVWKLRRKRKKKLFGNSLIYSDDKIEKNEICGTL